MVSAVKSGASSPKRIAISFVPFPGPARALRRLKPDQLCQVFRGAATWLDEPGVLLDEPGGLLNEMAGAGAGEPARASASMRSRISGGTSWVGTCGMTAGDERCARCDVGFEVHDAGLGHVGRARCAPPGRPPRPPPGSVSWWSNSTLAHTSSSSGPRCSVRMWMSCDHPGLDLDGGLDGLALLAAGRLADQQALHLDHEDDGDDAEQHADGDRAVGVPVSGCP